GAGAVSVDVIDISVIDAGFSQSFRDGPSSTAGFGVGLRDSISIETAAQAKNLGVNRCPSGLGSFQLFEYQHAGPFTQNETVASAIEGPRTFVGGKLRLAQGPQSRVGQDEQRIDPAIGPAGEDNVSVAARHETKRLADRLRARGTGRGDRVVRPL